MASGTTDRDGDLPPESDSVVDDRLEDELDELAAEFHAARRTAVDRGHDIDDTDADPLCSEEEAVVTTIEDTGFELLGVGAARAAFALPNTDDYVVKVARYGDDDLTDGVKNNNRERLLYDLDGDNYPLAPVVAAEENSLWIVMPFVDKLADDPHAIDENPEIVDFLHEVDGLASAIHLPEVNPQNVGYHDGDLYLFDYGRPPRH